MVSKGFITAALVAALALEAQAAGNVVVEGVNMPAYVTRGGQQRPLGTGEGLQSADEITTAAGSRVLLRLGDGSAVRLGENARFVVTTAGASRDEPGLFRASLRVLAGAFRFTTSALAKARSQREISIQLPTVTAGIRGTDLWGKATADREFIVLIEGAIGVRRGEGAEVAMDQPRSVFNAPNGEATPPLAMVTTAELAQYAAETEIAAGTGAARAGGKWKVVAGRFSNQNEALELYDRLRTGGYAASIGPVTASGGTLYRVQIVGLPSRAEAINLGRRLQEAFGITAAGVAP